MLQAGTLDGIPNIGTTNSLALQPTRIPSRPPVTDMSIDSMRNCSEMTGPVATNRHAQTDLLGALGDGDEHDVHDADTGDEQREGGSDNEDDGHGVHRGRHGLHHLCLRTDGEVIFSIVLQLVVVAQHLGELLDGSIGELLCDS